MGGKGSSPPPPVQSDPGFDALSYLFGKDAASKGKGMTDPELQGRLVASERQWGPEYLSNALNLYGTALSGTDGTPGIFELDRQAAGEAEKTRAEIASQQRGADIADIEKYGAQATAAYRESDPYMQELIGQQRDLTSFLYDRANGDLAPEQRRMAEQQARESFADRGRINDNAGVAAEILNREAFKTQNRNEAQQAGGQLFPMLGATSADPFQALLGRPSGALAYGQGLTGQAGGFLGQSSPQLFNPDTGVNVGMQNAANTNSYNANTYGAQQAASGSMWGGLFQGAGAALSGASFLSDRRLKRNITRIGQRPSGLPVYRFSYLGSEARYVGVMAQEALDVAPDAVSVGENGFLQVDYSLV